MKTKDTSIFPVLTSCLLTSCFQNNNTGTMKKIERDNAVINYEISGSGDTTLLFVHGSYNDQTYKGTCHFPMLENPDGLNKSLQEIIQKISISIPETLFQTK
jgi:hypothetical protein